MRQLRLRPDTKAVYMFDMQTKEHMVLYRRGKVAMSDQYTFNTVISNRSAFNETNENTFNFSNLGFKFGSYDFLILVSSMDI